jgi:hypothetical protein
MRRGRTREVQGIDSVSGEGFRGGGGVARCLPASLALRSLETSKAGCCMSVRNIPNDTKDDMARWIPAQSKKSWCGNSDTRTPTAWSGTPCKDSALGTAQWLPPALTLSRGPQSSCSNRLLLAWRPQALVVKSIDSPARVGEDRHQLS